MKKLIVGSAAIGAVVALRPVVKRRMVQKMRDHCRQMMGQCAGGTETRAHCQQMASHSDERSEPVATA